MVEPESADAAVVVTITGSMLVLDSLTLRIVLALIAVALVAGLFRVPTVARR